MMLGLVALTAAAACGGIAVIDGSGGAGGTGGSGAGGNGGAPPCMGDLSTNPHHCGYCEHSCLGGACEEGVCQPVQLAEVKNASALALNGDHVWFAGPISRISKSGGMAQFLADNQDNVWGVAVDDQNVYWGETDAGLFQVPKAGGPALKLAPRAYRVAVDATHVYGVWQGVFKVTIGSGEVQELAQVGGAGIALDDDWVYFAVWSPGALMKVAKSGGPVTQLAQADNSNYVAIYDGVVYWTSDGGRLNAISTSGGEPWLVAHGLNPYGVWADADGVYWTDLSGGEVWMQPAGGGDAVKLAKGMHSPRDVVTDADAVYWTNDPIYGAIMKVAKP